MIRAFQDIVLKYQHLAEFEIVILGDYADFYSVMSHKKDPRVLQMLIDAPEDIAIAVDSAWKQRPSFNGGEDFVSVHSSEDSSEDSSVAGRQYWLEQMHPHTDSSRIHGEWIGLMRSSSAGTDAIRKAIIELRSESQYKQLQLYDLFNHLVKSGTKVAVHYIVGNWLDVDNLADLAAAERLRF